MTGVYQLVESKVTTAAHCMTCSTPLRALGGRAIVVSVMTSSTPRRPLLLMSWIL